MKRFSSDSQQHRRSVLKYIEKDGDPACKCAPEWPEDIALIFAMAQKCMAEGDSN